MVVERILRQLTPQRVEKEIEAIQKIRIPKDLQRWVDEYKKVGKRDDFIWKMFLRTKECNCILTPTSYKNSLKKTRFLITMFVVLLDDIADKNPNKNLFNELLKVPSVNSEIKFNKLNQNEIKYLKFIIKVWHQINKLIKKFPLHKKFEEIFLYDIDQIINAMEYDYLINKSHYLINKTESWLYCSHTMKFITIISLNLMCLPNFDLSELGVIREIAWQIQKMARIGNWISTWEREIKEKDFTSGVFAYAISLNVINVHELENINVSEIIKRIKKSKVENELLKLWEYCYDKISKIDKKIKTVEIKKVLHYLENLLMLEIISKEYK